MRSMRRFRKSASEPQLLINLLALIEPLFWLFGLCRSDLYPWGRL